MHESSSEQYFMVDGEHCATCGDMVSSVQW